MPKITTDYILGDMLMHSHDAGDISNADTTFLKLDQTTVQHVINDAPQFDKGITVKAGEWLYLDGA